MKYILIILTSLLLFNCRLVATFKIRDAYYLEQINKDVFIDEIPFELINGMLVIDVTIDNKVNKFIFDTGASTIIDTKLADEINCKSLGKVKSVDSNRNKKTLKKVILNTLFVGNTSFSSIVSSVYDFEKLNTLSCTKISGILGVNIMNKCVWQIDYKNQKIIFSNTINALKMLGTEKTIDFISKGNGTPQFNIYANGVDLGECIIDTGSNGGIDLDNSKRNKSLAYIQREIMLTGVHSTIFIKEKKVKLPALEFGQNFKPENVIVSFHENEPYGYIGNKFLKDYIVTIDWHNQKMYLNQFNTTPYTYKNFGFHPTYKEGKLVVGSVYIDSPIYKKGLRIGDVIVSINAIDFETNSYEKYCKLKKGDFFKSETIIDLGIKKNNEIIHYKVAKTDLIEGLN